MDRRRIGKRLTNGIIIKHGPKEIADTKAVELAGEDIIVVQTKGYRLWMYLMGQAFFSREIMRRYEPGSIETVVIREKGDDEIEALCRRFDITVEVMPEKS